MIKVFDTSFVKYIFVILLKFTRSVLSTQHTVQLDHYDNLIKGKTLVNSRSALNIQCTFQFVNYTVYIQNILSTKCSDIA